MQHQHNCLQEQNKEVDKIKVLQSNTYGALRSQKKNQQQQQQMIHFK